jgi:DNA-binding NarL/FixJ family response regulator
VRVVVADDHVLFREGLVRVLAEGGFEVVGQAGDGHQLLDLVAEHHPDVAIVDIRMPPTFSTEGLVAARELGAQHPDVGVLVLSEYLESHYALSLVSDLPTGVGYLLKRRVTDLKQLLDAVRRVGAGEFVIDQSVVSELVLKPSTSQRLVGVLTDREREVLAAMAEGRSNQGICDRLFLTLKTVETHVRSIFNKLDLASAPDDNRRVLAVLIYLSS